MTGGILRHFRALSTPEQSPALGVLSTPAHPQVTQTVRRLTYGNNSIQEKMEKEMNKNIQEILRDIRSGKNVDVYLAILLSAVLAILGILDIVPFSILGGVILASMSWLSLNVLLERKERKTQNAELLQAISAQNNLALTATDFFKENYVYNSQEFQDSFKTSHDVVIFGMSQSRMITAYGGQIRRILTEGGSIKFVITDPDGIGTEMSIKRGSTPGRIDIIRQQHWATLVRLSTYPKESTFKGSLEIKLIDLLPPFTLYGFDIFDTKKGKIFVWITPFREPSEKRPGFVLTPARDPDWFAFFRHQFEKLWSSEEAKNYDLNP